MSQDKLHSMYSISHWLSHLAAISASLKTQYYQISDRRYYSRAGFGENQVQEIRPGRRKNQNQYFISHNYDEAIVDRSNMKKITFGKILMTSTIYEMANFNAEGVQSDRPLSLPSVRFYLPDKFCPFVDFCPTGTNS